MSAVLRTIHCCDAIEWLQQSSVLDGCSLVSSLPDISEFRSQELSAWKNWFIETAALIISRTPPEGVTIFFQTDIKYNGEWIDKGFLCQTAAEKAGTQQLWHKIACRNEPGKAAFGRPGFSHLLCFSKALRLAAADSTADVLDSTGEKLWERGMGVAVSLAIARFIAEKSESRTIVNPFCGQGSMVAAANAVGLHAVGIERSTKRAACSETLQINADRNGWIVEGIQSDG